MSGISVRSPECPRKSHRHKTGNRILFSLSILEQDSKLAFPGHQLNSQQPATTLSAIFAALCLDDSLDIFYEHSILRGKYFCYLYLISVVTCFVVH